MNDIAELRAVVSTSPARRAGVTVALIKEVVAASYGLQPVDLEKRRRTPRIARPRQVAIYLADMLTPNTRVEIGRRFNGLDPSTVAHAVDRIEELCQRDRRLSDRIREIMIEIERKAPKRLASALVDDTIDELRSRLQRACRRDPAGMLRKLADLAMTSSALAIAVLLPFAGPASAGQVQLEITFEAVCVTEEAMFEGLATIDQMVVAEGINNAGGKTLILASPAGDWSLVVLDPAGVACMVDWGDAWHMALPGDPS